MSQILFSLALMVASSTFAADSNKLKPGDVFPALKLKNIHGSEVNIPDPQTKWVHLQFRRFAGCPICNLHLQSFVSRIDDIKNAGIHEVVIFHSPDSSLLPYQGRFPFDVIGDPEKKLYRKFGIESSIWALLNPEVWSTIIKANMAKDKPKGAPEGGPLGLPADFLISSDGKVLASHYGTHAYDQWSVDELLSMVK